MKTHWKKGTAAVFALSLVLTAFPQGASAEGNGDFIEKKMGKLTEKLSLTADQQTQIRSILESKKKEMEEMRKRTDEQINAVLTPEQKEKFEDMKKEWKEKKKEWKEKHKDGQKS